MSSVYQYYTKVDTIGSKPILMMAGTVQYQIDAYYPDALSWGRSWVARLSICNFTMYNQTQPHLASIVWTYTGRGCSLNLSITDCLVDLTGLPTNCLDHVFPEQAVFKFNYTKYLCLPSKKKQFLLYLRSAQATIS